MVMKIMDGKFKLKGHLKHLTRWPLYLTALLIILNIVVYAIDIKAGVVVTLSADLSGLRCRYFLLPQTSDV